MKYRFAHFLLDMDTTSLSEVDGGTIPLQPRSFELLLLLLRQPGKLVPRETIFREIWSGLHVSPNVLPVQVGKIRAALGDTKEPYQLIETVPRKGLRFVGDVSEVHDASASVLSQPEPLRDGEFEPLSLPQGDWKGEQPTIAVLRFGEVDPSHGLGGLASALPADIIASLSRLRLVKVIAAASSFRLYQASSAPQLVRSVLGADYVLGGHVERMGTDYAIYIELVDTRTQELVWSDRFELDPNEIHELRKAVGEHVVSSIERQIPRYEAQRLRLKQPVSLTAWQAFHLGSAFAYRRGEANMARARVYFERAVAIDPGFARAWAGLAQTYAFDFTNQSADIRKAQAPNLLRIAQRAVEADPDDPSAALAMGWAITNTQTDGDPGIWFGQALESAPSFALAHQQLGITLAYQGEPDEATRHASASLRLSPQGTERFSNFTTYALSCLRAGDVEGAVKWGRQAALAPYDDLHILLTGVCANHWGGDIKQAAAFAERLRIAFPDLARSDIFALDSTVGADAMPMVGEVLTAHGIV